MQYFLNYLNVFLFMFCININLNNANASTILIDILNIDNSFNKSSTSFQKDVTIFSGPTYHTKVLDFREQSLAQNDVDLIQNGRYEDISLASTNIKIFGLTSLIPSQKTLLSLDIEEDGLESDAISILSLFEHLQSLNAARNFFKDADIEIIGKKLGKLQDLNLVQNNITSKSLVYLKDLESLETLDCGFIDIGNEGIHNISQIKSLKYLYIRATGFNDAALQDLITMPNLELVDISQNRISPAALTKFISSIKAEVVADHMLK